MAWFKQTEQNSPGSPQSQKPAASAEASAAGAQISAPVNVRPSTAASSSAPALASLAASRVSRGIVFRGEITGREDLSIDGDVQGTVHLEGARITVGPAGRVRAGVTAREIVIHGEVHGDLRAEERVEIGPSGSVRGTAAAKRVAVEDGAAFNGSMETLRAGGVSRPSEVAGAARAGAPAALRAAKPAPAASAAAGDAGSEQPARRDEVVPASDSRN